MSDFRDVLAGLRREAARTIAGNIAPLIQIASGQAPTLAARQPWNLPAKYEAAKRIAAETLAAHHGWNDAGDAQRHAELSRRMTSEIGPVSASLIGIEHEIEGAMQGQPWPEATMDLMNNAKGIRAGLSGRPVDPRRLQNEPISPALGAAQYERGW
jgi:hypothetical protein